MTMTSKHKKTVFGINEKYKSKQPPGTVHNHQGCEKHTVQCRGAGLSETDRDNSQFLCAHIIINVTDGNVSSTLPESLICSSTFIIFTVTELAVWLEHYSPCGLV